MTAKFRISARVQQRNSRQPDATMITSINPGDSTVDWLSERVFSMDQLKALFNAASDKKKITFLLEFHYAIKVFPKDRSIDFISIEIKDWQSNNAMLTPACKDLKVIKHTSGGNMQTAVTLQLSGRFTSKAPILNAIERLQAKANADGEKALYLTKAMTRGLRLDESRRKERPSRSQPRLSAARR